MQTDTILTTYRISPLSLIKPVILFLFLLILAANLQPPLENWLIVQLTDLKKVDFIADFIFVSWASIIPWLLYIPALLALKKLIKQLLYTFNMSLDVTADAVRLNSGWPISYKAHIKFNRIESVRLEAMGYPVNKCANVEIVGLGGTKIELKHLAAAQDLAAQIGQPC